MKIPLTEDAVAKLIIQDRWAKNTVLPKYTPNAWWENDVCQITKPGYWIEYEIKLTLADFKRDAGKVRELFPRPYGEPAKFEKKHDLLATTERGPSQFYYVAPEGVLDGVALPAWAGLIVVTNDFGIARLRKSVEAPRRHKRKDEQIRAAIFETCYWRFHRS